MKKKIYLLVTDTGTLFTRLIKSFTRKPYNHASIAFDAELSQVYSFGRKKATNPWIGGFVKEDVHSMLFQQSNCAIYSLTLTHNQFHRLTQYTQDLYKQKEKYRYNLLGLFGVAINTPIKRKNAFFCSQFVASVLKENHIITFAKDISLIEPSDLPTTADFELVYEGRLRNYTNRIVDERIRISYPFQFKKASG